MMLIDIDKYRSGTSKGIIPCKLMFIIRTRDSHIDNMMQRWLFNFLRSPQPLKASVLVCTFRHESSLNFTVDIKLGRWCSTNMVKGLRVLCVVWIGRCGSSLEM